MVSVLAKVSEQTKLTIDTVSTAAWISALTGMLTNVVGLVAGVLSLLWAAVRLYETKTVQDWLAKRKKK